MVPERYLKKKRWFLLTTKINPPRPWGLTTPIPVFSCALVQRTAPERRYLVYAHSPLCDREHVEVLVPGFGWIEIGVRRGGDFYLLEERTKNVRRLSPLP